MRKVVLMAFIALIVVSCKHERVVPESLETPTQSLSCNSDTVYFVNDIQPLINSTCATSGCHDAASAEHGVDLSSYIRIIKTGEVKPFRPEDSELYEVLFEDGDDLMPPPPMASLTREQKELIRKWISQGAKNNQCIEDCNLESVSFANDIQTIISNNCASCHTGANPEGGILLSNYTEISFVANSGLLVNVLSGSNGAPQMPPGGSVNDCNMDKITKWIEDGTPNN
ncbi:MULTISPECIES: c-type cytochrome domain-containing protein [unclassified Lentimicrobium]|uniref:c-type cytochrome domain-containing protein n=1 Tax=unclassified Lentimicrobium TaxID=2677434 RepID=UPI0015518C0B|nr:MULTISPECIES: c-type cytochrome domain-containing protein [unclassified Lentimicrobium]NPD45451.1 hypothetical protein [Lentimicrobium sp. S6]NPD86854.1 hypothetical protein [Lentimicrobium sp. L6]